MQIIQNLLLLRFKQLHRMFSETGYLLILFVLIVTLGLTSGGLVYFLQQSLSVICGVFGFLLLIIHYKRKDRFFIQQLLQRRQDRVLLYFLENLLGLLPFILLFGFGHSLMVGISLVFLALLPGLLDPYLPAAKLTNWKGRFTILPLRWFELRFFIEMNPVAFWFCVLVFCLSFTHWLVFPIACFLLQLCLGALFAYMESREMIKWEKSFVLKKILSYFGLIQILVMPFMLLSMFLFPEHWYIPLLGELLLFTTLILLIGYKYKEYHPERVILGSGSSVIAIYVLLMYVPGFVIISLIYALICYFKAEKKMRLYYA